MWRSTGLGSAPLQTEVKSMTVRFREGSKTRSGPYRGPPGSVLLLNDRRLKLTVSVTPGSVSERRGGPSPPAALRAGRGPAGRHGEAEERQPDQRQHGGLHRQPA